MIWVGEKEAAVRIPSLVRVGVKTGKVLSMFLAMPREIPCAGFAMRREEQTGAWSPQLSQEPSRFI